MKPIDRRKHDEDYAERMVRGARLERVRASTNPERDTVADKSTRRPPQPKRKDR